MKTLYVSDLDGTLLNSKGELSDSTAAIINSLISHGLEFTVNTSRTPKSAEHILSKLNLKLPAIVMNGGGFWDCETESLTDFFPISAPTARRLAAAAVRSGCEPFLFGFENGEIDVKYTSAENPYSAAFISSRKSYYRSFIAEKYINPEKDTLYIICIGDRDRLSLLKNTVDKMTDISSSLFISENEGCYLEIYSRLAGKWNGTRRLSEKYGFGRTVCFGDNLNDIEMLKNADLGIAVANGYGQVKNAADIVIGDCDSDSVAEYLMVEWSREPELK